MMQIRNAYNGKYVETVGKLKTQEKWKVTSTYAVIVGKKQNYVYITHTAQHLQ